MKNIIFLFLISVSALAENSMEQLVDAEMRNAKAGFNGKHVVSAVACALTTNKPFQVHQRACEDAAYISDAPRQKLVNVSNQEEYYPMNREIYDWVRDTIEAYIYGENQETVNMDLMIEALNSICVISNNYFPSNQSDKVENCKYSVQERVDEILAMK